MTKTPIANKRDGPIIAIILIPYLFKSRTVNQLHP